MPSRFSDSASSGSTMASTSRTISPPSLDHGNPCARRLEGAVGRVDGGIVLARQRTQAEPCRGFFVQRHDGSAGVDHEVETLPVDPAIGPEMAARIARNAETAGAGLRDRFGFSRKLFVAPRWRRPEPASSCPPAAPWRRRGRSARPQGSSGYAYATLASENADITTQAAKPRLTATAKTAILAKRMSEALTGTHVPRGLTRRVGSALAGSSGQGCRG